MAVSIGSRAFRTKTESARERERKNKCLVPAGDEEEDDYGRGMFDVWNSLSPPLNINKHLTAVTNTDKREINDEDSTHTERAGKTGT